MSGNKKVKMEVDAPGRAGIPKFLKGFSGLNGGGRRRGKKPSRFYRRVSGVVEKRFLRNFPLQLNAQFGLSSADPSIPAGDQSTHIVGAKVDLAENQVGYVDVGTNQVDYTMTKYLYESASWGVGPTTGIVANSGVVAKYGPQFNAFSWALFVDDIHPINDTWVDLKYMKILAQFTIPATMDSVYCTSMLLLMPLLNVEGDGVTVTKGDADPTKVTNEVGRQFGQGFFYDEMPNKYHPEKGEMMVLWRSTFKFSKGATSIGTINAAATPTVSTQYLAPVTQRIFKKKFTFGFGEKNKGLRFYRTNQANNWIPTATAGTYYYFLKGDRTTPVIPVFINKWWTASCAATQISMGLENPLVGTGYLAPTMLTSRYVWYRVENPGHLEV